MRKVRQLLSTFVIVFFVVLIAVNAVATILIFDNVVSLKNEVRRLEEKVDSIEIETVREATLSEQKLMEFYKEIDEKSNEMIDRLLTIVGIIGGVVTFFSLLLVFKAPHDIDKRIDKLNLLLDETKSSAEEAKYQAAISAALARDDKYQSLQLLTAVVNKYPEKIEAYLTRGAMYDDLKQYDAAISDYEIARKLGCDPSVYYNNMAIAYRNKGDQSKAIKYYTKAIQLDKDNATYYCNRACSYDELERYDEALKDYAKAIELDNNRYEAYYNRNFTYEKLWREEEDEAKQKYYIKCRKADLDRAIELNPEDGDAQKILKKFTEELIEKGFLPSKQDVIAQIDEKIGDIGVNEGDYLEAFEHYVDAFNYHAIAYYLQDKQDHGESVDRICVKIVKIILNKRESDVIEITKKKAPILAEKLATIAAEFYTEGEKRSAEMVFTTVLPNSMAALNLAFMCRRNETKITNYTVSELLEMSDEKKSAVWCINKALCYIDGIEAENDWHKAIEIVKEAEKDIEAAVKWWSDTIVVGEQESNAVFLLLQFAGMHTGEEPIESRIDAAEADGYVIPEDLKPETAAV